MAANPLTHAYDGIKMLQALEKLEAVRPELDLLHAAGVDTSALRAELDAEFERLNKLYHHFFPAGPAGR